MIVRTKTIGDYVHGLRPPAYVGAMTMAQLALQKGLAACMLAAGAFGCLSLEAGPIEEAADVEDFCACSILAVNFSSRAAIF